MRADVNAMACDNPIEPTEVGVVVWHDLVQFFSWRCTNGAAGPFLSYSSPLSNNITASYQSDHQNLTGELVLMGYIYTEVDWGWGEETLEALIHNPMLILM